MHADQIDLSTAAVADLVAAQFPQWRTLPVRPVRSTGTVNALFRLGDHIVLRFPLRPDPDPAGPAAEQDHLRTAAAGVPVAVPEPLGLGAPGPGCPGWWTAYRWIDGRPAEPGRADSVAATVAAFVTALHRAGPGGRTWNGTSRGGPLDGRDDDVQRALAASRDLIDTDRIAAVWAACRDTPRDAPDTGLHADLMPGNLLLRDGRLTAVIDWTAPVAGDPAVDLMPAWNLLTAAGRAVFRRETGCSDATWERGRGWAVVQAAVALPYYVTSNPAMAASARYTLTEAAAP